MPAPNRLRPLPDPSSRRLLTRKPKILAVLQTLSQYRSRPSAAACTLALMLAFLIVFLFPGRGHVQASTPAQADETHRNFLPIINGDNSTPPVPTPEPGELIVSTRPYIVQKSVTVEGARCVTFAVTRDDLSTGAQRSSFDQLELSFAIHVEHGSVDVVGAAADAVPACAAQGDAGTAAAEIRTDPPGCAFAQAQAGVSGDEIVYTCVFSESDDAVYYTALQVKPEPFGDYDADFDQVQDDLAPDADQRIIVLLTDGPTIADRSAFLSVGGRDIVELPNLNILMGTLSGQTARTSLRDRLGARVVLIGADQAFDSDEISVSQRSSGPVAAGPLNLPWVDADAASAPAATVNIAVAVLDTGIDSAHPALTNKLAATFDALEPGSFPADEVGQGTHVAALIAGKETASSDPFRGVAPDASLAPVRIGSDTRWQLSDFLAGVDWIIRERNGLGYEIAVANNSVTTPGLRNPFWTLALRKLTDNGVLVVSAAGNDGSKTVGAPGDDPAIVTVGVTNGRADVLDDSSVGAPNMTVIKPDLLAPGSNIYSARAGTGGYENRTGSEIAAPLVSGVAAQIILNNVVPANGDEDDDGIPDNDPWNGRDDNRDDILDGDLGPWDASAANLRKLKSLLLMSTAQPHAVAQGGTEGAADSIRSAKTVTTGHGAFDPHAMTEALERDFCAMDSGSFSGEAGSARVWIRRLYLHADREYTLKLDGPAGADYDLYLYRSLPDGAGNPVVARAWGSEQALLAETSSASETLDSFRVRAEGVYYAVVRHVSGAGPFTLSLTDPVTWTILVYASAEMPGETDLDAAAFGLLNQLESVGSGFGSTQEVQVLALIDYDRLNWSKTSRVQAASVKDGDAAVFCVRKDLLQESTNRSVIIPAGSLFDRTDSEVNMADPGTLTRFMEWGMAHFPARHTALVLWGDPQGYGWKSAPERALGPAHDTRADGQAEFDTAPDALTIVELADAVRAALPTTAEAEPQPVPLDMLVFDMGQMANLDVAYQFLGIANHLVAWETPVDRTSTAYASLYSGLLNTLRCGLDGADWSCDQVRGAGGADVATQFVSQIPASTGQTVIALALRNVPGNEVCATFTKLASCVSEMAANLIRGMDEPGTLVAPEDNAQVLLAQQVRAATVEMNDRAFVDLYDLARRLAAAPALASISEPAAAIAAALETPGSGPILARSSGNADVGGLSVFFPADQIGDAATCTEQVMTGCGWDTPLPSQQIYADDEALTAAMAASATVGAAQLQADGEVNLAFVQQKQWDEFLQRYYAPAAVVCARTDGGACMRSLVVRLGDTVTLDASGSSDSDGEALQFYWDTDIAQDADASLPDYTAPAPVDEPCTEDCDRDGVDEPDDDADAVGATINWACAEEGQTKVIRVMVHDDHNLRDTTFGATDAEHWNVDSAEVTIYCAVEPQFNGNPDLLLNGARVDYQLVVVAHREVTGTATVRLTNPLPPALTVNPESIEAGIGTAIYVSATHTLEWTGQLDRSDSATINYAATVDNSLVPLNAPFVANQALLFDGVITRTLTVTVPAVAVHLAPQLVSPGDVMTYTVSVPARAEQAEPEEVTLQFLGETNTASLDAYNGSLPTAPTTFDSENNLLIWPADVGQEQPATYQFTMRAGEDAECGAHTIRLFLWPPGQSINTPVYTVGNCKPPAP